MGSLIGRVVLEDVEFQQTYAKVMGQMRAGAGEAQKAAAGVSTLDRAFADTAGSATGAAGGIDKAARSSTAAASAEDKAAAAATRHAEAVARVAAVMGPLVDATSREQAAELRLAAAQDRLNTLQASGTATTARLAAAQAAVVSASDRASAAQLAAMESTSKWRTAMGGLVKTAGELGLFVVGFEAVKAAIDIGKEASKFQATMLLIKTNANASTAELRNMTAAVLALAGQTATAPIDLANALYHVEQNGLRGQAALDALRVGAEGAKIGMADVEDTTNTMTIAIASGITGMGNLQRAMGFMIATAGTGDMRLKDLNETLSTGILSVAKGYGATLQDVAAVLATLGDNGIRAQNASTALRQTLMGFAQPVKAGEAALDAIGIKAGDLAKAMEQHGLVYAMNDLNQHMAAAGITGAKTGSFITEAFGKRAGAGVAVLMGEIDRLNIKYSEAQKGADSFASKWDATTHTASFAMQQLGTEAQATGIQIAQRALPVLTAAAGALASAIPAGAHAAEAALHPLGDAWHYVAMAAGPVGDALKTVIQFLGPAVPTLEAVAAAALTMWAAFKGYQIARTAVFGVMDGTAKLGASFTNARQEAAVALGLMQRDMGTTAAIIDAEAAQLEADFAEIAAAAQTAAADQAEAQAMVARAFQTASEDQIAALEAVALAERQAADDAVAAAATTAAAAETAAADVDAAGAAARIGWTSVLGPIGLAAIGVMTVVSMFHRSTDASKEATDAAKAYSEALKSDGSTGSATIVDTIVKQLSDNNVAELIARLNTELQGAATFTGTEFVNAISTGGSALDTLRARLTKVAAETETATRGTGAYAYQMQVATPAAKDAAAALAHLNTQYSSLSKAAQKDLADTKAFTGVSASIDKVSQSASVASKTAQQYAGMMGIVVDKNGVAAVSSDTLTKAVTAVQDAYNTATQAGNDFLSALQSFSGSAGTAADRAKLIGATLKAANGDALGYAGAMSSAYAAQQSLVDAFAQQQQQLSSQADQADQAAAAATNAGDASSAAADRVTAAQARLDLARSKTSSTTAQIKSAEASLASAQASAAAAATKYGKAQAAAAQQGSLAFADTEKAAINLNNGSIDYARKGAPALVQQLQAIQDAAEKAAEAVYQHELATKGSKQAADDAYKVYQSMTSGQLVDEADKLGVTSGQAKKLADQYFGMPKDVKTMIEQEGADPVLTVLNKIGQQLAFLTGHPWTTKVDADTTAAQANVKALANSIASLPGAAQVMVGQRYRTHAFGGVIDTATLLNAAGDVAGEAGREAIVPLDKPLSQISPSVRGLAAFAQGKLQSAPIATQPVVTRSASVGPMMPGSAAGYGSSVVIEHYEQHISNPVPEPVSVSGPAGLRRAAAAVAWA